jgi:hypothetical protein
LGGAFAHRLTVVPKKPDQLLDAAQGVVSQQPERLDCLRGRVDIAWHLGASQEGARRILDEAEVMLRTAANVRFPDLCVNGGGR